MKCNLAVGFMLADGDTAAEELRRLRGLYEPYAQSLARYLRLELPPWIKGATAKDNWQTTAWGQTAGLLEKEKESPHVHADDHF